MTVRPGALALTPLLLFLALFFGAGLYFTAQGEAMGFYQLRAPVAILPALALGIWLARRRGLPAQQVLLSGMGESNVMLMCLIFLLAGGFATVSKAIGAVDAVVALGLGGLPPALLLPGLFLAAAFVSLSIGTSMGTVAAVAPLALGVADAAGLDRVLVTGAVVGGAMFGDNLSIISDTTIAATRSQGAEMRDKFRENFRIALPAAAATAALLAVLGDPAPVAAPAATSPWLVLPYVLVLVLALAGLDVVLVLGIGMVASGLCGFWLADYDAVAFARDVYAGFESMVEITLLSILVGGLAALMKAAGGLDWLAQAIARFARGHTGRRSGEFSIAALSAGADALTANNTVAILVTGGLARDIAQRHGISP
ncbi:MAG TPA: Na+/H+ antiporter NhaC family protein, partial [Pseudoxanthomonas sp.]|nr:Na+/H+ antiporter NhaC family protein [Pseudoxanthomonas sp.]